MASDRPTRPHGRFTPASRISAALTKAGYAKFLVRNSVPVAYSGFNCSWEKNTSQTRVSWRPGDDVRDDQIEGERTHMLAEYAGVLSKLGYTVTESHSALYVPPKTARRQRAVDDAQADTRKAVHHEVTGKLVGWITPTGFVDAE